MSKLFFDESHAQNILQRMWEQCDDEQFCDVVLIAGTEETRIPAHRAVLRASSEKFYSMITSAFTGNNTREAKLPSEDGEILKALVEYSYSGRIEIKKEIVENLIATADSLHLGAVVNACGELLVDCKILSEKAQIFCMKHFTEICRTDEFLGLDAELLGQLLASDDLQVPNEAYVFKNLITWLAHDPIEREQHKDDLLKLVRMPLMQPSFLADHVKSVCTSNASRKLYDAALEWHLLPKRRALNASKSTKPRRDYLFLMAITDENEKFRIRYHCPQSLEWKKWLGRLKYRECFGAAVMDDDLFIVGGRCEDVDCLNTVTCLSLKTMTLKVVNPMNECRYGVAVAAFQGFLYAVGGCNAIGQLNSVEKWDPLSNNWSTVAPMEVRRADCATAILNEKLYVAGGYSNNNLPLNLVEFYNPQTNAWTTVASMCEARFSPGVEVFGGMLYAVGGFPSKTIERYDPEIDKWTIICSLSNIVYAGLSTSYFDKIVVLFNNRVEEYSPEANEWKVNAFISGLNHARHIFSYSGKLLVSKFLKN